MPSHRIRPTGYLPLRLAKTRAETSTAATMSETIQLDSGIYIFLCEAGTASVEATRWCLEQPGAISCRPTGFHSVLSRGEFTIPLKIGVPVLCCGCLYLKNPRKLVKIGQFFVCNLSQNKGMKTSTLTPKDVLAVCCPTCGAASGKPCELGGGGLRSTPHRDRELSAGDVVDCVSKKKNSS